MIFIKGIDGDKVQLNEDKTIYGEHVDGPNIQ